jgi:hypothetical protein
MPETLTFTEMELLENVARELRHRAEVLKVGEGNLDSKAQLRLADELEDRALSLENVVDGELRDA